METPEARGRIMRAVKGRDTKPEIAVRRLAHRLGYRFRLHRPDLPGKPDLAFPGRKAAIYVNGCFWHGHACKRGARVPKANRSYWMAKIARNMKRDRVNLRRLRSLGWRGLVIWECAIKDGARLAAKIRRFLDQGT
jgi:DNA mismatch endonuclease (patch repair protein)